MMRTSGHQQVPLVKFKPKVAFELWVAASWSVYEKKLSDIDGTAVVWKDAMNDIKLTAFRSQSFKA